jgi:predicted Zn-dependent peptidase
MDLSTVVTGVLSNSMRWVAAHDSGAKTVAFHMLTPAGSRMESPGKLGMAHFCEHLLFDGTTKHSAAELIQQLSQYGGDVNAFTTNDMAVFHSKMSPRHLERMAAFFSEILFESTFNTEDIEREKGVVLQEIQMRTGSPVSNLTTVLLPQGAWHGTPAAEPVGGREHDILSITRTDVLNFVDRMYRPENIVLSIAGNILDLEGLPALLERYFGYSVKNSPMPSVPLAQRIVQNEMATYQLQLNQKDAVVAVSYPYMTEQLERYAEVLSNVLIDTMNSRLFVELRTKTGLVYSVSPLSTKLRDVSLFGFLFMIENQPDKVTQATNLSLDTLNDIVVSGITEQELAQAKTYLQEQKLLALEDTMTLAAFYGQDLLLKGKVRPYQQSIDELQSLTLRDIQDAATELFHVSRLNLAVYT